MKRRQFTIALAAGGTGGHVIPAQALAAELARRGHRPVLLTDRRGLRYAPLFPDIPVHEVANAPAGSGLLTRIRSGLMAIGGSLRAARLLRDIDASAVIGFGGYPSLPSGFGAFLAGVPLALHEQNAVFGGSNRLLARVAQFVALSAPDTQRLPRWISNQHVTGNPVRPAVTLLRDRDYPTPEADGPLRILVIGGSQGATILSDVVPAAISALPKAMYARLAIIQQAREEDLDRVRNAYQSLGIAAAVLPFIDNLPTELAEAHLMIARSGASTVSELSAAGRPAILVPFAAATDDHQTANAAELRDAGGAWVIAQKDFTPGTLAKLLQSLLREPTQLVTAAAAARATGRPNAASDIADLIERMILARGPLAALPLLDEQNKDAA
ncbi:undecaprenyldiphospho-muramoylpentapeptide beta-N-acetylglucosaminyltransferase [Govanella unica]|uniref:UDP-N-acetylglucosamine--N-acetylmuramyl-(pentapeptide) pyrophosphoryl-undecaprenol N-acetylglucosamine transferase n=1 Tax=Govanella unica TaxID=2975056 RepID=A0A9X3Z8K5_9PROT|nr:undecaprenyldiphospho-muramoylpentapeptide beta-N-acetylglucosaminyltransferase [Govania unica]MDA5195078.1 undecaprenyldiphospho-muramoylpentapeptide beta-N-acetylglucosaminyltransferase [Govania unica]